MIHSSSKDTTKPVKSQFSATVGKCSPSPSSDFQEKIQATSSHRSVIVVQMIMSRDLGHSIVLMQ
jgi:hypothetical protein